MSSLPREDCVESTYCIDCMRLLYSLYSLQLYSSLQSSNEDIPRAAAALAYLLMGLGRYPVY